MTSKDIDCDVMIVGGGPAGISTWLHLHKMFPEIADNTILIEKETYPREKVCGGALGGWTSEILKSLRVNVDVPKVNVHKVEFIFGNEKETLEKKKFFDIVQRYEFDHFFAQTAVQRGLVLHENEKLLAVKKKPDYATIKTTKKEYNVKVLVGADGALSTIRKNLNNNTVKLIPAIEIFHEVNPEVDHEYASHSITIDFTPMKRGIQGYLWHFPCIREGKRSMNHGICDFYVTPKEKQVHLKELFQEALQDRHIHGDSNRFIGSPIPVFSEKSSLSDTNILLVGDAAGIDSMIGGGIHVALSYGELAANEIAISFEKHDFSFKRYRKHFDRHLVGRYIQKLNSLSEIMYTTPRRTIEICKEVMSK